MLQLQRNNMSAEWEDIGEGMSGEYDPDDPDDVPLLRFTVYKDGEQMEDSSYCTLMPTDTPDSILKRGLICILDAAELSSPKRALEELSWMKPEDFKGE